MQSEELGKESTGEWMNPSSTHACPTETKQKHSDKQGCSLPSTLPKAGSLPLTPSKTAALVEDL